MLTEGRMDGQKIGRLHVYRTLLKAGAIKIHILHALMINEINKIVPEL